MVTLRKILWGVNAVCFMLRGSQVGLPSFIGPTTSVIGRRNIKIGKRVRIWPGARIEVFDGATLTIEDEVSIGPNCHITLAGDLTIGEKSTFSGASVITNITHSLKDMHLHPLERPWQVDPVHLGKRLFVGHGAKILPGTALNDGCVIGANTVVANLDAPENAVIVGMPGKVKRIISE